MGQDQGQPISPTLERVLEKYLEVMKADEVIEDAAAVRLNALLQSGKTPKPDEISAVLFLHANDDQIGNNGDGS